MKLLRAYYKSALILFLPFLINFFMLFSPSAASSVEIEMMQSLSGAVDEFSDKVCLSISSGLTAEAATQVAAKQMIRNLIFSGSLDEMMSIPKEEMVEYVSNSIFNRCASDVNLSKEEYATYIFSLANNEPKNSTPEPFKPFGIG